jgi:serine/threonine-protein kinase
VAALDRERWQRLSSQLDELLDLEPAAREARMASIQAESSEQAVTLAAMMARLTGLDREGFLETPARHFAGLQGQVIGPYTIDRELGSGGMGSVWLARRTDGRYEADVAIKFLNLGVMMHGGAQRFAREGSILARLAHRNIARLIDAGVAGNRPYLVLEYIDGEPIDDYCQRHALSTRARLELFLDVLAAVEHAHTRSILHRDLKPQNILVNAAGEVKLLDFGIAKLIDDAHAPIQATELTRIGGQPCTTSYAAPEQIQQGEVSTATDVYALGVLLYVLLSGRHPTLLRDASPLEQMREVVERQPARLSDAARAGSEAAPYSRQRVRELRGELDSIVAKALQKMPAQRYATAAAFADDVRRYFQHLPIAARPDTRVYRLLKFVRRHRIAVAAAMGVLAMLATGIDTVLVQTHQVGVQHQKAEGLIEFMLSELRGELQPVGRLDVLDAVGGRVLAYYDEQETRLLDADALGRRSRALHLVGEIAELRGNLEAASAMFERAAASTGQLLERMPGRDQQIFAHSQSMYWVGYVAWRRGLLQQAREAFNAYLALTQRLVRLDASNVDWRIEAAYAHQNLGVVLLDQGNASGALVELQRARSVFEQFQTQRKSLLEVVVSNRGWIAKAKEDLGDMAGAIAQIQTQLALQRGPEFGSNREQQETIAIAESELSRLELWRGDSVAALRHAQQAVRLLETLRSADAENVFWAKELAWAYVKRAHAETATQQRVAAQLSLISAQQTVDGLLAARVDLQGHELTLLGHVLLAKGELALRAPGAVSTAALQNWLTAVAEQPFAGRRLYVVAQACLTLGDLHARAGDALASEAAWRQGVARLSSQGEGSNPMALAVLAQLQLRLAQPAIAHELSLRIARTDFQHTLYLDLVTRLAAIDKVRS